MRHAVSRKRSPATAPGDALNYPAMPGTPKPNADHHEACGSYLEDYGRWDPAFAPEPEPFVDVDHYQTCGHRLACRLCGNTQLVVVVVPGGYWTGALCERCGILDSIHEG